MLDARSIISKIDHSLLKPNLTVDQIKSGCELAIQYQTNSVYVQPYYLALAGREIQGSKVKLGTVIAFPHGNDLTSSKVHAVSQAISLGADELDIVMSIPAALNGDYVYVEEEIRAIMNSSSGKVIKVILETAFLSDDQVIQSCRAIERAGAHYAKTSTGFAPAGATVHHVRLMRSALTAPRIKAAGGISTLKQVLEMLEAGTDVVGTSNTEGIVKEMKSAGALGIG